MTAQLSLDDVLTAVNDSQQSWLGQFLRAVSAIGAGETFTTAQVAADFGLPDPPNVRSGWGGAMSAAKAHGLCVRVGYVQSPRSTTNGSAVALWQRTSRRLSSVSAA